jgi:hypothetical protein
MVENQIFRSNWPHLKYLKFLLSKFSINVGLIKNQISGGQLFELYIEINLRKNFSILAKGIREGGGGGAT